MEFRGKIITEDFIKSISEAVFDVETTNALKLTLANGTEIPLYRQMYYYFKNNISKYELEEAIVKAASIFDYAKQDVKKYILAKAEMDKLNNPNNFFQANFGIIDGTVNNTAISTSKRDSKNNTKQVAIARADNTTIAKGLNLGRAASSQLNEDFNNLEDYWKKEDAKYDSLDASKARETIDINIPSDITKLDLNEAVKTASSLKTIDGTEVPEGYEAPDISYTGINLSKSMASNKSEGLSTNKSLSGNLATMDANEANLTTSLNKTSNTTTNVNFVYADASYKALSLYVANFKESFFSSFSSLFLTPWIGYSNLCFFK